ncbi:hypothetical protein ACIO6U_13095 [Streptomyces sp. NPDC087422]|uniref:hypothetical protein n=1 Tax=Streptomyces sp. NPDC087422 TaxID=3365786 RepID=UPI00380114A4
MTAETADAHEVRGEWDIPHPRAEDGSAPAPQPAGSASYQGNRQQVGAGAAAHMGDVGRDLNLLIFRDGEEAAENILTPRLREGAYSAAEIEDRLRGFVEPPSYPRCRAVLEDRVLLLRGARGAGAATAAFALLRERFGADGITGLDAGQDLARWRPSAPRGYILAGATPQTVDALNDVVLSAMAGHLVHAGAALVIVVDDDLAQSVKARNRLVDHVRPRAYDVAAGHLKSAVESGELSPDHLSSAWSYLDDPVFAGYLDADQLPQSGVDVAEELRAVAAGAQSVEEAVTNLSQGGADEVCQSLDQVAGKPDELALLAAVALLHGEDRQSVQTYAAALRERLGRWDTTHDRAVDLDGDRTRVRDVLVPDVHGARPPNVLGPSFESRLACVEARLLPRRLVPGDSSNYWSQAVDFPARHRADQVLRQLWWDRAGMETHLCAVLLSREYQPGYDLTAGRSIGRVLCHATGTRPLQPLQAFAKSGLRWHRRLAAYALGEAAQNEQMVGRVTSQVRDWSRVVDVNLRCTVAETCAGSFGLGRPGTALQLLHKVLDGPVEQETVRRLYAAVSFALRALLTESANRDPVLRRLAEWSTAQVGTGHHAYAVYVMEQLGRSAVDGGQRTGALKLRLSELVVEQPEALVPLVMAALESPGTDTVMSAALTAVGESPDSRHRVALAALLETLAAESTGRPGVVAFLLTWYHAHSAVSPAEWSRT